MFKTPSCGCEFTNGVDVKVFAQDTGWVRPVRFLNEATARFTNLRLSSTNQGCAKTHLDNRLVDRSSARKRSSKPTEQ